MGAGKTIEEPGVMEEDSHYLWPWVFRMKCLNYNKVTLNLQVISKPLSWQNFHKRSGSLSDLVMS